MRRPSLVAGARLVLLLVLPAVVAGCLSFDQPTPSPAPPTPTPSEGPSLPPRDDATLVVGVPSEPARLMLPASDVATSLAVDLLYDPLYRLDGTLTPQPELAGSLPLVTGGGTSWSITLASPDLVFADGTPLRASDVVFSLLLARSPACTLGRDLCDVVARYLEDVQAPEPDRVLLTLTEPWQPFLAEVLGRVPILSEVAVRATTAAIVSGASVIDASAPDDQVARIANATNADSCLADAPPFGCRLSDHTAELETMLTSVGLALPDKAIWTDLTGTFDQEAYAGALLDRVAALGQVLTGTDLDQQAAALALADVVSRPLGSGPYRIDQVIPGQAVLLSANPHHVGGAPGIPRIELRVVQDPAVAATYLQTGDVDWLPSLDQDQVDPLATAPGIHAGRRALPVERTIVFNTRAGRVYADPRTRQAFALCLDRDALVKAATNGDAMPATSWSAPGSWAFPRDVSGPADPTTARALLDAAGWVPGTDGIRVKDGQRLSSQIAIRPSRTDLVSFAQSAAAALKACGIELTIGDLDLTGDLLLRQLQWPNDFDTVLISRTLGVDPDADMEAYSTDHATSEANPADENPGGYSDPATDALIASARQAPTQEGRTGYYAQLGTALDTDQPAWPIWFETAGAAIADRVRAGDGPVDPTQPRYDWDIASWSLRPRP